MTKPRVMSRSRNQIASSYAPESFFTFEGGLGACIAKSIRTSVVEVSPATKNQIYERIQELARSWYEVALHCRDNEPKHPPVKPVQCIDAAFLNIAGNDFQDLKADDTVLLYPSSIGYVPAPLTFVCQTCNLVRTYETIRDLDKDLDVLRNPSLCPHPGKAHRKCDWRQLDIVFVHWSGRWERPMPHYWDWDRTKNEVVLRRSRCGCGCEDVELVRMQTGQIGDWYFRCAKCGSRISPKDGWRQQDPNTLKWIGNDLSGDRLGEVRMQPTPYRASNAYYVQSDQFVDFKEGSTARLSMLLPGRSDELADFIGRQFGFGATMPDEGEIKKRVLESSFASKWSDYEALGKNILELERVVVANPALGSSLQSSIEQQKKARRDILDDLVERGVIQQSTSLPPALHANIINRQRLFASRYDPFRLALEHKALLETKLDVDARVGGKRAFVNFRDLDEDLSPGEATGKGEMERETGEMLQLLGIETMGLIREFDLCRFSFGYTRMKATPVLEDKHHKDMPVRLNLFPRMKFPEGFRHPVYVVTQGNEAIYVRLWPELVHKWLTNLNCPDMFRLKSGEHIGAGLLEVAQPMSRYLDKLPRGTQPNTYFYTYTLLHSYAHLLMRHIAEYSGLDLGSLGEYLFPADLAFVVYRNGTTMDLGNLSAMWRNTNVSLLRAMAQPRAAQCGSGTLCTHRGGSCPDCLMIPETTCIAQNKLLSRSVLRNTGGRPRFDERTNLIFDGFLDMAQAAVNGKA